MSDVFIPSLAEPKDDRRSPLIRFTGILKDFKSESTPSKTEGRAASMRVYFNFTDVTVIESSEPYPFPIASLSLPYSERADTTWDVWRKSVVKLLPSRDINELVGKNQEWFFGPCKLRRPNMEKVTADGKNPWELLDSEAWQVVSLEGTSSATAGRNLTEAMVELADGLTSQEFYTELFTKPELKNLPGFETAIEQAAKRELLENLQSGGLITLGTDGKWSKV